MAGSRRRQLTAWFSHQVWESKTLDNVLTSRRVSLSDTLGVHLLQGGGRITDVECPTVALGDKIIVVDCISGTTRQQMVKTSSVFVKNTWRTHRKK
jgi:hypothetical protein